MTLVEKSFDTGEVVLNYAEGPNNGPPILFIHGLSMRWQFWYWYLTHLSMRWQLYAVDLRGHGKSGWKTGHYTLEDYSRDVVSFIEHEVDKPLTLVGHSTGAMICSILASTHPEHFKGLVLGDPPCNFDNSAYDAYSVYNFWYGIAYEVAKTGSLEGVYRVLVESMPEPYADMWNPIDFLGTADTLWRMDPDVESPLVNGERDRSVFEEHLAGYDCDLLYPRLECPVLFIRGNPERGGFIPDADYEKTKLTIPNVYPVYLESHGHDVFHNSVEPALGMVTTFLESLRS